jgi:nitroreductase
MSQVRDFFSVVGSRASVRRFRPDPLPDDAVRSIIWAATRAPTAGGRENWLFVVVKSESVRREVHRLLIESHTMYAMKIARMAPERVEKWRRAMEEGMYLAPLYIAIYIDLRKLTSGGSRDINDAEFLMEVQSAAAAMENAILAAWNLGIGSVWLGVPLLLEEEFNKLLKPPPEHKLMGILALGYPAEEPKPRNRKPVESISMMI